MLNPWKDRKEQADAAEPDGGDGAVADAAVEDGVDAGEETPADRQDTDGDLETELAELKDRHLRLAAEFENFRKRTRTEAATGRERAQAELVQKLLPTLDDLARVSEIPHESTTVQALDEGIELILRNLRKQLTDAGLERIEAVDERFDPERHQAVLATPVDDPELDETVGRVFVDGYEFLGRLVRPAQVEVRRYEEGAAGEGDA